MLKRMRMHVPSMPPACVAVLAACVATVGGSKSLATSAMWPLVQCGSPATSAMWPLVQCGHRPPVQCGQRPPVQWVRQCNVATSAVWPPATSATWPPVQCGHRPPVQCDHRPPARKTNRHGLITHRLITLRRSRYVMGSTPASRNQRWPLHRQ